MKFELKRTAAISLLSLTLGAGLAGCSAPAEPEAAPTSAAATNTPSATATASPEISASASAAPSVSTAPVDTAGASKTTVGAKNTTDAFLAQVTEDMETFFNASIKESAAGSKQLSDAEFLAIFTESTTKTVSYIKTENFNGQEIKDLFQKYGKVYYDSKGVGEAVITADESAITLTGDTAVVKGSGINASIDGQPVDSAEIQSGDLTLEYVDGKWLISGFTPAA